MPGPVRLDVRRYPRWFVVVSGLVRTRGLSAKIIGMADRCLASVIVLISLRAGAGDRGCVSHGLRSLAGQYRSPRRRLACRALVLNWPRLRVPSHTHSESASRWLRRTRR